MIKDVAFGLAHIKREGCAIHPDDTDADLSPEACARQIAAYKRDNGLDDNDQYVSADSVGEHSQPK